MESLETPAEHAPGPTRLEMRGYILAILDELHSLSVAYGLDDLAGGLEATRLCGRRREH